MTEETPTQSDFLKLVDNEDDQDPEKTRLEPQTPADKDDDPNSLANRHLQELAEKQGVSVAELMRRAAEEAQEDRSDHH
ncbi:ribbon-helix-helix protein, CopG family [Candidatus Beckwithbacteria bacterium]|nr:ribbon-helix-helix protein, CopG family [Candidatus Beckwithbacteria bacterium]